jgi:hypothetical protein
MAELAPRAVRLLEMLPPYVREDPEVVAVMREGGAELDRIEEFMLTVREHAWPHRATDEYGILSVHERMLGLPVAPVGVTVADRQSQVRARMKRRRDGRKAAWVSRINEVLGADNWEYAENTPGGNQLSITLRVEPGIGLAEQARRLAEVFTPAAVQIIVGYEEGFILGVGGLGEDAL